MIRRSLTAVATVALVAGFATASADAEPTDKGAGCMTKGEFLHLNNGANNANGLGDDLAEVQGIVGDPGYWEEQWFQDGRVQKNRGWQGCNCPHGTIIVQFSEYTNAWRLHDKYQECGWDTTPAYPYPDN